MLRRKHCSAKTQALKTSVPYGSTKVEWLESSGTQYIDTKYIFNDDAGISCDFSYYDSNKVMLLTGTQNCDTPVPYGDFSQILLNYNKNLPLHLYLYSSYLRIHLY